jgi:hypothetical protein
MQPVQNDARQVDTGVILRAVAVIALLGSAAVHLSLLGARAGAPNSHITYFVIAGWAQLGLALWCARGSRAAVATTVVAQAALLASWLGGHAAGGWIAEDGWGRLDTVAVALSAVVIVAGAGLLLPGIARRPLVAEVGFAGVGAIAAVVALLSGLLFSPAWRDDAGAPSAARLVPATAHDATGHDATGHDATGHDATGHHASGQGHDHDAQKQAEIAFLFPDGDSKGWEDVENGVVHAHAPDVPEHLIPAAQRTELQRQLRLTEKAVEAYPTVAAAEAAGYRRAGPFTPGLGAHYVGGAMVGAKGLTDAQIVRPSAMVYAGTDPDSPIVGFMYIALGGGADANPAGFAGPNDHWHTHSGVCVRSSGDGAIDALGADGSITEARCKADHGSWMAITQSLLHVWTVPSYTDPLGVFAHTNPAVTCPDGTYHTGSMGKLTACLEP